MAPAVVSTVNVAGSSSRVGESPNQRQRHSHSEIVSQRRHNETVSQHAAPAETASENPTEIPFPTDLKRLLQEVAKTGACPWLSWDQEMSVSVPLSTSALASKPSTRQFSRTSQGPPWKKHRNGVHKNSRRRTSETPLKTGSSRKRPLGFVRTSPSAMATNSNNNSSALSSVGSGHTSGSEPDNDSTHYECDSEGTSTTSNSEMSVERLQFQQRQSQRTIIASMESNNDTMSYPYKTLQEAIRSALGLVLDHFYKHQGGYKPSAAEKRWTNTRIDDKKIHSVEELFQQRRQRLLRMLDSDAGVSWRQETGIDSSSSSSGPPFTIQRIAEVLLWPDRVSFKPWTSD